MPLILMCGFPGSGKSAMAKGLKNEFEKRIGAAGAGEPGHGMKVILHSDESLGISHDMYRESNSEKAARGEQMSAVRRDLSKSNIVILDAMNYIKGFRYQLYTEAKNAQTTYCVVQVVAPTEVCFANGTWDEDLTRALIMRFEEPDGRNRWDSPLVPVGYDDPLPMDEVWEAIVLKKAPKPNQSVAVKPAAAANYLQELDRLTSEVIAQFATNQDLNPGACVLIRVDGAAPQRLQLPAAAVPLAKLQRLRRAFVALNRMQAVPVDRIVPLFTEYLDRALDQ